MKAHIKKYSLVLCFMLLANSFVFQGFSNTMKHILINVHFVAKADGTGNFLESSDGASGKTGFNNGNDFAEALIDLTNTLLLNNEASNYPRNGAVVYPINIQLKLTSVFYDKKIDNTDFEEENAFSFDKDHQLNLYLIPLEGQYIGGVSSSFSPYIKMDGFWEQFKNSDAQTNPNTKNYLLHLTAYYMLHELGHSLDLPHPFGGRLSCCPEDEDNIECFTEDEGIEDTPTWTEFKNEYPEYNLTECGCGSSAFCYNNTMHNSVAHVSFTKGQIDRIHETLTETSYKKRVCEGDQPAFKKYDGPVSTVDDDIFSGIAGFYNKVSISYGNKFHVRANSLKFLRLHAYPGSDFHVKHVNYCPDNTISSDIYEYHFKSFNAQNSEVIDKEKPGPGEVKIYPNPSSGLVNIEMSNLSNGLYSIFNSTGLLLEQGSLLDTVTMLDLSKYGSGVYFVRIISENKVYTSSLLIQ